MNSDVKITTAKIYQFPQRVRPAASAKVPPIVKAASGSGWYHDEAIQHEANGQHEPKPIKPTR